jgi:hypothetical protein
MKTQTLNHRILYATALFLAGAFLILTSESYAWSDQRQLSAQIAEYHGFMREHPKASTQIRENPQLVYDGKFLKSHPEVDHFLKGRPELRKEIARRPGQVFGWNDRNDYRYGRYDRDDRHFGWWDH